MCVSVYCNILRNTGWVFSLVPPRKVLSMELVPPNREKWLSLSKLAKILLKKWKSKSESAIPLNFSAKLHQKVKVWKTLTWTCTFSEGFFASFGKLSHFSLLGGTSSILRTFLGGTSQKRHPVSHTTKTTRPLAVLKISTYLTCAFHRKMDRWKDRSFPILGHLFIWWESADVMEMKHRLEAPVDHFPKTATLPSHKNPASQEISDSLHVRQGATSFNFFGHCIDIFLRCPCVPELNGWIFPYPYLYLYLAMIFAAIISTSVPLFSATLYMSLHIFARILLFLSEPNSFHVLRTSPPPPSLSLLSESISPILLFSRLFSALRSRISSSFWSALTDETDV